MPRRSVHGLALLLALHCLAASAAAQAPPAAGRAELAEVPEVYEAVGTVRPKTEITVESQVQAKILDMKVRPGQNVAAGDALVVLDARELAARVGRAEQALASAGSARNQAREAIAAAKAAFDSAQANHGRIQSLFKQKAVTAQEMDQTEADFLKARAALSQANDGLAMAEGQAAQAEKALEEARINLGYARILAPEDGQVAKRLAEPGDLALPGKPLLVLQTGLALRLEALVREGLIAKIRPGAAFPVRITALDGAAGSGSQVMGTVEEVVPSADPKTRTFLVKVGLPSLPGVYPGMFGRLLIPLGTRQAVLAPREAVRRIGQLTVVTLLEGGGRKTVAVTLGRDFGDKVEVLSGLNGGEDLVLKHE